VSVTPDADGDRVLVAIEDEGAAIPASSQVRFGEPFGSARAAGSGLSLAVAKRIVLAHGAEMSVSSTENGVRVELAFPRHASP
jgi:signal transduction histidine kinase